LLFDRRNAGRGATKNQALAHPDLDEHNYTAIPHDKINFPKAATIVSLKQSQIMPPEKCLRESLGINTPHPPFLISTLL
jgi:hypothetical protein